jgi:predicted transcriptional regulator
MADIVTAYVGANALEPQALPALMKSVYDTLTTLSEAKPEPEDRQEPAVPIETSVSEDVIICLEDGLPFKSLKRHLRTKYDLTPEAYREKWGLPADYPMVAPSYAKQRSKLARESGLGRRSKGAQPR